MFILIHGFWSWSLWAGGARVVTDEVIFVWWTPVYKHKRSYTWLVHELFHSAKTFLPDTSFNESVLGWMLNFMCSAALLRCKDLWVIACVCLPTQFCPRRPLAYISLRSCQPPLRNEQIDLPRVSFQPSESITWNHCPWRRSDLRLMSHMGARTRGHLEASAFVAGISVTTNLHSRKSELSVKGRWSLLRTWGSITLEITLAETVWFIKQSWPGRHPF